MSDPSLFVSPLVRQAARNLCHLEFLAENPVWTYWLCRRNFWRTRRMMSLTPDEATAWLPALAVVVHEGTDDDVFFELARWPLPEPLPPEALPWRAALTQVWEQHPADTDEKKSICLAALVRLDRRAERLPEWLAEARRALDLEWYDRHLRLAALAGWRPRPGDGTPHGDKADAAQAWGRFWEELYKSPDMDGLIAAAALLHLTEAGWLTGDFSREELRDEFCQRVQQWSVSTYQDMEVLRILLSSVPADASAPEQRQQDIMAWLELTHRNVPAGKREAVWNMLAAWQREGILERSGRGRLPAGRGRLREPPLLLPDLARTLEWEQNRDVLQAMAGYVPEAAEVRAHPEATRDIVARWEAFSWNDDWRIRQAAWVARWNFLRAGVLTAEEQGRFGSDYVDAVKFEPEVTALLTLAQITPPGVFPLATWTGPLSDQNARHRLAAQLAIHGWLVGEIEDSREKIENSWKKIENREIENREQENGNAISYPLSSISCSLSSIRRQMRQVLRRAGQEVTGAVAPFVNLPHDVLPDFRRLHEIETALAAGQMPPPPDTGAGNRPIPRTVPARLPEAHPRTGPTGITDRTAGRTAGSDPQARHPFPEVIRHE